MAIEQVELFIKKVQADHELKERLKQLITQKPGTFDGNIVQLAAELCFNFTKEELQQYSMERVSSNQK